MKYLKTFEAIDRVKILDFNDTFVNQIKKLYSHLINIFDDLGYDYNNYYDNGSYETLFNYDNVDERFKLTLNPKNQTLEVEISESNLLYITNYFKTIDGLSEIRSSDIYSHQTRSIFTAEIIFKITKNIDYIISQISKDDFQLKMNTNKYNL